MGRCFNCGAPVKVGFWCVACNYTVEEWLKRDNETNKRYVEDRKEAEWCGRLINELPDNPEFQTGNNSGPTQEIDLFTMIGEMELKQKEKRRSNNE